MFKTKDIKAKIIKINYQLQNIQEQLSSYSLEKYEQTKPCKLQIILNRIKIDDTEDGQTDHPISRLSTIREQLNSENSTGNKQVKTFSSSNNINGCSTIPKKNQQSISQDRYFVISQWKVHTQQLETVQQEQEVANSQFGILNLGKYTINSRTNIIKPTNSSNCIKANIIYSCSKQQFDKICQILKQQGIIIQEIKQPPKPISKGITISKKFNC